MEQKTRILIQLFILNSFLYILLKSYVSLVKFIICFKSILGI